MTGCSDTGAERVMCFISGSMNGIPMIHTWMRMEFVDVEIVTRCGQLPKCLSSHRSKT